MKISLLAAIFLVSGCATTLTPQAEKINLLSATQKEKCQRLKLITFTQSLGPDKSGNAMKGAMNEAASIGANGFYVISTTSHSFDGASVIGEALRCP